MSRTGARTPGPFFAPAWSWRCLLHGPLCALEALPPDAPSIVLATGRLVGESFDHPPLDTLLLAMPVSQKGTLQQYAGRLHRAGGTCAPSRKARCTVSPWPTQQQAINAEKRTLEGYKSMAGVPARTTLPLMQKSHIDRTTKVAKPTRQEYRGTPSHCLFDACITGNQDAMGHPLPVFKGFMSTHHKRALADGVRP
jgi:hypothetical protein